MLRDQFWVESAIFTTFALVVASPSHQEAQSEIIKSETRPKALNRSCLIGSRLSSTSRCRFFAALSFFGRWRHFFSPPFNAELTRRKEIAQSLPLSFIINFNLSFSLHIFRGSEQTVATIDDGGTMWSRQQNAVSVRHAFKTYGPKSKPNQVLNNLNMTVAKGTM